MLRVSLIYPFFKDLSKKISDMRKPRPEDSVKKESQIKKEEPNVNKEKPGGGG